jgi:hypothetical protein
MKLSEEQCKHLAREHSVYANEVCDRCAQILGPVRWTIQGQLGAWCSQLCRDGFDHKAHTCHSCGVSLNGKRKHARFCSDTCRKRLKVRNRPRNPETPIANKGVTGAISQFGYGDSRSGKYGNQRPSDGTELRT